MCVACLRQRPAEALAVARRAHVQTRREFGLPPEPPRTEGGVQCTLCANECLIGEGERGYCGLRTVCHGRLVHLAGTPARGLLHWYRDPLPTNCVADWVCPGHHAHGYHNLAVFYASCTFNCLFCQNWHFREASPIRGQGMSAQALADVANSRTFCVCYFGGDPSAQMAHALAASRLLAARGVRICWETNGNLHPRWLDRAVELSLISGGCLKFDLKAYNDTVHQALTGVSNRRTLENFARAAQRIGERPDPPLLVASTLLVPGYVDAAEVSAIARFIASLNPHIPYALLAFAPNFYMPDLPCTSVQHAEEAEAAARAAGLTNVHIGNRHLLIRREDELV
ncbi:MAG: radical SAM protein [Anaerolineae bacterium]|nr:radical SAM protein [Anaerolineae bacterium]MDW8098806.1 radical SAM protein [Anaerolineae bacterium]